VTHFNRLFWRNGANRTVVIEPGIVDPGYRYRGTLAHGAFVADEPVPRERFIGSDLLPLFEAIAPVDVFGTESSAIGRTDLTQADLHRALPERRVYLHLARWTSLGLSLIEAMHLGLPVLALATTEVSEAVPADAGVVSNDLSRLAEAYSYLIADGEAARAMGQIGRAGAQRRYGLERFLHEWDGLLKEVTG
jgi:glycosyltransferase involved in cell wall biosynthesis